MVAPKTNTQGVAPKPNQWKTPLPDTRDLEKAVNTVSVLIYGNKKLDYWLKKKKKKTTRRKKGAAFKTEMCPLGYDRKKIKRLKI